jgi:hypothetical protein
MKKYIFYLFALFFLVISCEKDDFCIEETTPKMVIRFYDNANPTTIKAVSSLTVWAEGLDSIYTNKNLDSIAIPLNLYEDFTNYLFASNEQVDTINFKHELKDIYVSRSCGYKTNFENLDTTVTTRNWIKNISIKQSIINHDTTAHINIFH